MRRLAPAGGAARRGASPLVAPLGARYVPVVLRLKVMLVATALLHLVMGSGVLVRCERTDGHKGLELGLVGCECCGPPTDGDLVGSGEPAEACEESPAAEPATHSASKAVGCTCGDNPVSVLAARPARGDPPPPAALLEAAEPIVLELPPRAVERWRQAEVPRPRPPRSTTVLRC